LSKELENKVKELADMINYADHVNTDVSSTGVDWHIDHSLKVIINSCEALKKSDPSKYKPQDNQIRDRIFKTGFIPRGVAKAPKTVTAIGEIKIEDLQIQLKEARKQIDEIKDLHEDCHYYHPYFGALNLNLAIQFFSIHTNHHLKIIKDIINKPE